MPVGLLGLQRNRSLESASEEGLRREGEVRAQRDLPQGDVVRRGGDRVHPVARDDRDRVVPAGDAEDAEKQVDGLVAAVADEDALRRDALEDGNARLQGLLARVGIAVEARVIGAFVGIEEDAGPAGVFVPGGRVRAEVPDVGPDEGIKPVPFHVPDGC